MKNQPKNSPNEGVRKWARDTDTELGRCWVKAERKTERLKKEPGKEGEGMDLNPSQPGVLTGKRQSVERGSLMAEATPTIFFGACQAV